MAQAARLNLRMQKELKLLLTDPPPGASFPTLSDDSSASSLTSIDALFQGPEGTVYANGVFKIEIQIPERYPFQPPIVTFATPIYHPNIDNGGRICLDILNLPPKGMWQPSLNISTVLTSIGLLLSEPNPDDGLMHEASRDYKYNRQVFDRNARSMTEKYATAGETVSARGSHGIQTHTGQSTAQTEMEGSDASICITQHFAYHERYSRSGRKLSLESLGSSSNGGDSGKEIYKVPAHDYSKNHIEIGRLKEANNDSSKSSGDLGKLQATRNKLLLKVSVVSHSRNGESENTSLPNQCASLLETQTTSTDSPESSLLVQLENIVSNRDEDHIERSCSISVSQEQQTLHCVKMGQSRDSDEKLHSMPQHAVSQLDSTRQQEGLSWSLSTSNNKKNPSKDATARKGNCSTSIGLQKIGLFGLTPSLGPSGCPQSHLEDEKGNLAPVQCLEPQLTNQSAASAMISSVSENGMYCNETGKQAVVAALKQSETAVKLPQKPVDQLLGSKNNMILHSENPSSPHAKYLRMTNDVRSGKKQQINQVCDRESTDKFKQLAEGSQVPEAVIVLDSEDSEDENVPLRSRLSLTKRCLSRKRKFGF